MNSKRSIFTTVEYQRTDDAIGMFGVFTAAPIVRAMPRVLRWFGLLVVVFLVALPTALHAQFEYSIDDGKVTITGYDGPGGALVLPDTIEELPVTGIGDYAFRNNGNITSVTLPSGVTRIGMGAFQSSSSLTDITIGNGAAEIGDWAFSYCTSLTGIAIPASVAYIGISVFTGCDGLTMINVDPMNPNFSSLEGVLFNKKRTVLIQFPGSKSGSYTVPDGVVLVGRDSFSGAAGLTRATLPEGVTGIGEGAFFECVNLTNVTLPNSLTSMGDYPFSECSSLTSVIIPSKITSIGRSSFYGCDSLTDLEIGSGVAVIEEYAFLGCSSLKTLSVPDSVVTLRDYAFHNCTGLTNITVGNGVTTIGDSAFGACTNLTEVVIGDHVASIGMLAFAECTSLQEISIPDNVTDIGQWAFLACNNLSSVEIGSGVSSLGLWQFQGCSSLTGINVVDGNSVFSSVDGVVFDKSQTKLVLFPEGRVGSYVLPSSTTSVGAYAFGRCTGLTSVTLPENFIYIEEEVFIGCSGLTSIRFEGDAPSLSGSLGVDLLDGATVFYLPGTTGWNATFGFLPTSVWQPSVLTKDGLFGFSGGEFGFTIGWSGDREVAVDACVDLANPVWLPVSTNVLSDGLSYFSDPNWETPPARYYRLRVP